MFSYSSSIQPSPLFHYHPQGSRFCCHRRTADYNDLPPSLLPHSFAWLEAKTRLLLQRCQLPAVNDTAVLFTPDASASYGAQWTRDFAMALSQTSPDNFPRMPPTTTIAASVAFTLSRVTLSGLVPDRVQADGVPMFAPGSKGAWPIQLAWDNM